MLAFEALLLENLPELSSGQRDLLVRYREAVQRKNQRQNLTRFIEPQEFLDGHILDVRELLGLHWMEGSALDLGSGVGVPGIVAAILEPREWILVESERRKAEFLTRIAEDLGLKQVRVLHQRAEVVLKSETVDAVVARAVGSIRDIHRWIKRCSTWNKLILFKGPRWTEEWEAYRRTRSSKTLKLEKEHLYEVGLHRKKRTLLRFRRSEAE